MSKTPVLTKKQQKLSLSGKKTKTRETIRNVLASPYSKYWPLISTEHHQALKNVLNQHLPKLLQDKVKIPWIELKKVPKSERKKFREQYANEHLGSSLLKNNEERDGLILGINDITKALEREEAKSVLISEDVLPQLMVEHVIDQSVLLGIPVLVVPDLRNILKEKCGISSAAVAFTECPKYKLVRNTIEDISKSYPVPKNHINFDRAQKLLSDSVIVIEDSIIEDISKTNLFDTNPQEINKTTESQQNKNIERGVECDKSIKSLYLYRSTKDKRVFVPENSTHKKYKLDEVDSTGFLSLSSDSSNKQHINEKEYLPLNVLKVKGDINRNKRKIEAMKERKSKQKSRRK